MQPSLSSVVVAPDRRVAERRPFTESAKLLLVPTCVTAALLLVFPAAAQITITVTGQSMLRSDLRETAPAAVPIMQSLLRGDVIFTNFEAAIAERGETVSEGRGFLSPARNPRCPQDLGLQPVLPFR